MARKDIRRYSPTELKELAVKGDVVPVRPDAPEIRLDEEFWHNARIVMPSEGGKERITLRVDRDVLEWFKGHGRGYQTRINAVLRSFVEMQRHDRK